MNKLKDELLATSLSAWRKKGFFLSIVALSLFPLFIAFYSASPDLAEGLWKTRHLIGIGLVQALAQLALAWYALKNPVPNYVLLSLLTITLMFQVTYGISVILLSLA